MLSFTLEITAGGSRHQVPLRPGLTRIGPTGGRGLNVEIDGAAGELHVWDDPPKVVRVEGEDALLVDGEMTEEALLRDGALFAWCGAKFRLIAPPPVIEEIVEPEPVRRAASPSRTGSVEATGLTADEARAWSRISAGLLVETGLADAKAAKRWQAAVVQNEWDADACAREILAASADGTSNPKFVERAGRLQRDLVMASFQRGIRGASRRARGAARSTTAFFLANVIAIVCYSAILLALLILARVKYDFSMDGSIDRMIEAVTPG